MTQPKLSRLYRRFTFKDDPKTMLQLPIDMMNDLKKLAEFNQRSLREEITARLIATLQDNEHLMQKDQLHQLIFNSKLAVKEHPHCRKNNNNNNS